MALFIKQTSTISHHWEVSLARFQTILLIKSQDWRNPILMQLYLWGKAKAKAKIQTRTLCLKDWKEKWGSWGASVGAGVTMPGPCWMPARAPLSFTVFLFLDLFSLFFDVACDFLTTLYLMISFLPSLPLLSLPPLIT